MADLQALVDSLAAALGRPVGVDDRRFRALAYSSHEAQVDAVRVASILRRQAPAEVVEWLESLNLAAAAGSRRLPGNQDLGMTARICVPLRFDGTLLGYLWLIDDPQPLTPQQLAEAERYAEQLALALHRTRGHETERARQLLEAILDGEVVALDGVGEELLASAPAYAALVLSAVHAERPPVPEAVRVRLADAADQVRRGFDPGRLLVSAGGERVTCVLACRSGEEVARCGEALLAAAREALAGDPAWRPLVGSGEPAAELAELPRSRQQARDAQRVALALGRSGEHVGWEGLGAYRTVSSLLAGRSARELLPDSVRRLLAAPEAETLVPTLERYLDLGGDARAAAGRLFLHRSTLYSRLHRIEDVAGVDLRSGEDRLDLHLGLRLWRLAGK